jgi:hypothetical protein
VSKPVNWIINAVIPFLITVSYIFYRQSDFAMERRCDGLLVIIMVFTVFYGVLKLRQMQADYDARCPQKAPK